MSDNDAPVPTVKGDISIFVKSPLWQFSVYGDL